MANPVRVGTAPLPVPLLVSSIGSQIQVRKRNGSLEPADVNKIVRAVERSCGGLSSVDPIRIAKLVPHFPDLVGEMFEAAYVEAEKAGLFARQLKARDLYARMTKETCTVPRSDS